MKMMMMITVTKEDGRRSAARGRPRELNQLKNKHASESDMLTGWAGLLCETFWMKITVYAYYLWTALLSEVLNRYIINDSCRNYLSLCCVMSMLWSNTMSKNVSLYFSNVMIMMCFESQDNEKYFWVTSTVYDKSDEYRTWCICGSSLFQLTP